jgi:hypothetical protein
LKTTTEDRADDRLWTGFGQKLSSESLKMIKNTYKTSSKTFGFNFGTDSWPAKKVENC